MNFERNRITITSVEVGVSSRTGLPLLKIDGQTLEGHNRPFFMHVNPRTMPKMVKFFDVLGMIEYDGDRTVKVPIAWDEDDEPIEWEEYWWQELKLPPVDFESLVGRQIDIEFMVFAHPFDRTKLAYAPNNFFPAIDMKKVEVTVGMKVVRTITMEIPVVMDPLTIEWSGKNGIEVNLKRQGKYVADAELINYAVAVKRVES